LLAVAVAEWHMEARLEQGVSAVIAGGMGSRAQALFHENRIGVIIGVMETDPEKAVLNYLSGSLATGDNICDH